MVNVLACGEVVGGKGESLDQVGNVFRDGVASRDAAVNQINALETVTSESEVETEVMWQAAQLVKANKVLRNGLESRGGQHVYESDDSFILIEKKKEKKEKMKEEKGGGL